MERHWRRINRAFGHLKTLDDSIRRWLDGDAYRIVKEHDPETRRTAYVAHIGPFPDEWADEISYFAHDLRSALDHLAFALNSKGYADTHSGAALPAEDESSSEFPIVGDEDNKETPDQGPHLFASVQGKYRHMPAGARDLLERLQPYKRGKDFRRDPLWVLHELSRIDKHRIDIELAARQPDMYIKSLIFDKVTEGVVGVGGPVYDGKELTHWTIPEGAAEPNADLNFTRVVAFGEGTPAAHGPITPTLRGIRNYVRFKVAFPLDRFL